MTIKEFLNKSDSGSFIFENYMVWKHEQGWSATNIKTGEYFLDIFEWDDRKTHVEDEVGRNYWPDVEKMLQQLEKDMRDKKR